MHPSDGLLILVVDDDEEDVELAREAFDGTPGVRALASVGDGEEMLDYLHRRGAWADPASSPRPDLILLDLNMPRMDGREALRRLKADPSLARIPVVVLTTSGAEFDIEQSYGDGALSFITKPGTFDGLVELARALGHYWTRVATLPPSGSR